MRSVDRGNRRTHRHVAGRDGRAIALGDVATHAHPVAHAFGHLDTDAHADAQPEPDADRDAHADADAHPEPDADRDVHANAGPDAAPDADAGALRARRPGPARAR